ncbi:MAG: sugar ABC transporter permease [Lachnospiraceae bacterium]|nr:sugar ABC transporter permease [Lachnospiraceae bacterium]MBP3609949.1 sugar ABC transporter permease [Lachnospiraceae bacterium]
MKQLRRYSMQRTLTICGFLALPLILLLVFTYLPFVDMVGYSFYRWDGYSDKVFTGLENYKTLFSEPQYFSAFKSSIYYFIGSLVQIVIALYFANVFFYKLRGKNFFKGVLFFPYLLNGVAIGFVFLYFFKPDGVLDSILTALGVAEENLPLWLGDAALVNWSLTFVSVWRYMGQNMVMFCGATQSISGELFEAAQIDGAGRWQQFFYIMLPNIRGIISLNLILAVKGAISVYEIPFIMTKGTGGSMTFVIKTLSTAFTDKKIGLSCAMGVILLLIVMVITFVQKRFVEGKEEQ